MSEILGLNIFHTESLPTLHQIVFLILYKKNPQENAFTFEICDVLSVN